MKPLALFCLLLAAPALAAAPAETPPPAIPEPGAPLLPAVAPPPVLEPELGASARRVPAQLPPGERALYRQVFGHIAAGRLSAAREALAATPRGLLHAAAEGQILLAEGQRAGLARLSDWVLANPAAPQARDMAVLARRAGAEGLPLLANPRPLVPVSLTPPMGPRSARGAGGTDADFIAEARSLIAADRALDVEGLIDRLGPMLTAEVRSEWAQRAAWNRYIALDDGNARRLGARAADGQGDWAAMGNWVAGLASFRLADCEAAARHFDAIGRQYAASDLRSAAAFWAARAHVRCERPHLATERLRSAVALDRTGFYGVLASRLLGVAPAFDWAEPDFIQADWTTLSGHEGARRAAALVEIGERGLADRELRHLAASGDRQLYEPVLRLAARLDLPATQYWLAQNPPQGAMPPMSARFPSPAWQPVRGWRVDPNLVFAHALQESKFITGARSGAGAKGIMQIMPGTARDLARATELNLTDEQLAEPQFNVEFGQTYLEQLRDSPHTGGLLPKVIAAYNAGPGSVMRWNAGGIRDNGDALLFIESIPFRETRHYVEVVLRNYWFYGKKSVAGGADRMDALASLDSLAAGQWPRFPQRVQARR